VVFLDQLRLTEQSASSPGQLVDSAFHTGRNILTMTGFIVSLAVISPWFTAVVLAAAVPAFWSSCDCPSAGLRCSGKPARPSAGSSSTPGCSAL
jgi:hypothetical protein